MARSVRRNRRPPPPPPPLAETSVAAPPPAPLLDRACHTSGLRVARANRTFKGRPGRSLAERHEASLQAPLTSLHHNIARGADALLSSYPSSSVRHTCSPTPTSKCSACSQTSTWTPDRTSRYALSGSTHFGVGELKLAVLPAPDRNISTRDNDRDERSRYDRLHPQHLEAAGQSNPHFANDTIHAVTPSTSHRKPPTGL